MILLKKVTYQRNKNTNNRNWGRVMAINKDLSSYANNNLKEAVKNKKKKQKQGIKKDQSHVWYLLFFACDLDSVVSWSFNVQTL